MNSKLFKLESFVDSLEASTLSENQLITLTVNDEDIMGGGGTNKNCSNSVGICQNVPNKNCTNSGYVIAPYFEATPAQRGGDTIVHNCTGSTNKKQCWNC